jgi:hypothetical protein
MISKERQREKKQLGWEQKIKKERKRKRKGSKGWKAIEKWV